MSKQTEIVSDLVSTIIPVHNRPEMIVECVDSVLNQTYRPIEIIIVDDGSNDNTPIILKQLAEQHSEIQILHQKNAGPGAARERGRLAAKGEYIQYLDSDDVLLKDKFLLQVNALNQNQTADVAYGKTDRRKIGSESEMKAWKQSGVKTLTMFPSFLRSRWWGTSTPLYRRSITDRAGSWLSIINEEDWEYDCRIASLGGKLVYVDQFVSVQHVHNDHLSSSGNVDPIKLGDRCTAREHIYESALRSSVKIPIEDMGFFSKSVFLLARDCAALNMDSVVKRLLALAIKARGKTTIKQVGFTIIGTLFGWPVAAKVAKVFEK